MVENTNKPLEGLKVLLYHLFTHDDVSLSSLKGGATRKVPGGKSCGQALQKQKLDLIYCKW